MAALCGTGFFKVAKYRLHAILLFTELLMACIIISLSGVGDM
jgi:hypothetical protein